MKKMVPLVLLLLATVAMTLTYAQEDDGASDATRPPQRPGDGPPPHPGDGPPQGRRPGPPPPDPFMLLFDTDQDDQISAAEIDAAAKVLRALDKDGDGVLMRHELPRPPRPGHGEFDRGRPGPPPPRRDGRRPDGPQPDDRRDRDPYDTSADSQRRPAAEDGVTCDRPEPDTE